MGAHGVSERPPWWLAPAAIAGTWLIRALAATWRIEVVDAPGYTEALARGERFVYAFWHCGMLAGSWVRRGEGVAVLVSQHRDGELIARIIHRLGYVAARGSSTRGGEQGVREMLAWVGGNRHLAITPDGPRGPAEQVKDGLYYLAARSGRRIVPIGFGVSPAWRLRSWDRFRVPKPFARICVAHGAPLAVEPAAEGAAERARAGLTAAIAALTLEMRTRAGEPA